MTVTDLTDACADLASWLPSLAAALPRDAALPGGHAALSSGSVVNPDVLHAMTTLQGEIPAACAEACEHTGETWRPRPLEVCLRAIPRFHGRLAVLDLPVPAKRLESGVGRWTVIVKFALGLRTPDLPIGFDCPLHDEPYPLVAAGAEGFLRDDRTVLWQHSGLIRCVACGASWPVSVWPHLGRMLAAS